MRKTVLEYVSRCLQSINGALIKCGLLKPLVVVCVDGGICSQMLAYLRGRYYAQAGIPVYYNLRWFNTCGKDMNGQAERPFELLDAFPNLDFKQMPRLRETFYQHFMRYSYETNLLPDRETLSKSVYLSRYPDFRNNDDFKQLFYTYFTLATCANVGYLNVPKFVTACGVHIRKGDMRHWMDVPDEYLLTAIQYVQKKYEKVKFFLFSDEPEWVSSSFVPLLHEIEYEIISGNTGYEDLLLCAQCGVIVASQGSMGRYAALLNSQSELILPNINTPTAFPVQRYRAVTYIN